MLTKTLITTILLSVAVASNGIAHQTRQELRPVPAVPATTDTSACDPAGDPEQDLREEFHQTYPLAANGRVSLENINGGVQIKVWDRASVQVDAIKKAWKQNRLAEAQIVVNATEESIRIKTEYPDDENGGFRYGDRKYDNPAIVEYTLTVPRKAVLESVELINGPLDIDGVEGNVKASSINGRVNARGLMGEARLSTVNGSLEAIFSQLNDAKPINLSSVNGNLTVIIPSNANASVRAATVHGDISSAFSGLKVKHGEYVGHNLDGQIGTGGPKIKLGNVNGGIRINNAQDGLPLSPGTSVQGEETGEVDVDVDPDVEVKVAEKVKVRVESARIAREAQQEAQRQVAQAMREAQRDVERAQREVAREQARTQRIEATNRVRVETLSKRATAQETKSFSVTGAPRVTLNTFDGRVTVHGWDKPEVSYTATKQAHDENVLKDISIQAQQQGQEISISATQENEDGSVNFDLFVPRQSTLHVSSGDGALNLEGVSGQITLRSGDGPIEVSNGGGQLQVNTGDGVIKVIRFQGQVDARTGDGAIALDGNFNELSARTGDGEISLTVPAGSSFTIETNAPDEITQEGFVVNEDVTPSPRVKRWRIGNGGKVFVLKTGEGKILLRPQK